MKITKELLEDLYIIQGLSTRECAKVLGLPSHGGIGWRLKKFGIKARPARFQKENTFNKIRMGSESHFFKGGKIEKKCKECGKSFNVFPSQKGAFSRCDKCKKERFDLTGKNFGILQVIEKNAIAKGGHIIWLCRCECGKTTTVRSADLKSGKTKSCGCEQGLKGEKNPNWKERIKVECSYCKKIMRIRPSKAALYENHFCENSSCYGNWIKKTEVRKGARNPKWIGGPSVAGFDAYAKKIDFAEKVRPSPSNDKLLEVTCTYCGRWFQPSTSQISQRIRVLYGQKGGGGECRLYCSGHCKKACPTYRKISWPEGYKPATSREVQPELRQMRLAIDNYECQKCGLSINETELHCHHYTGTVQNPIESADVDNTVIVCKKCHKWVHTQEGCRYFELRCGKSD